MTPETIALITTERLALWAQRAIEQHSTPVMMLSVGHDFHSGELNVHTTEEMTDVQVLEFLQGALRLVSDRVSAKLRGSKLRGW